MNARDELPDVLSQSIAADPAVLHLFPPTRKVLSGVLSMSNGPLPPVEVVESGDGLQIAASLCMSDDEPAPTALRRLVAGITDEVARASLGEPVAIRLQISAIE